VKLHITHLSDTGLVRSTNQDAYSVDLLDPRANAALLIIADGMGGYEGGEIASALAVETVRKQVCANAANWAEKGSLATGLIEAINQANQSIADKQIERPELSHMGTTITAALIWGGRIMIGHIGDSRAFFVGKKGARQVTTDHNVAGELVQGGHLTADQAAVHPQRHLSDPRAWHWRADRRGTA
jgi:serine/threonine protein phosphatase PrpC